MRKQTLLSLLLLASVLTPAAGQRILPHPGLIPPLRPPLLRPMPPPRIELFDVDAKPMQVREMAVTATIRGLHATVVTTFVFHNPNAQMLEGELLFPLPEGAAVCGYALDIEGILTEGAVVPKEKARVAFETETRQRVDPGLVEHVKGNLHRTRVYPLPSNGPRTIRIAYTTPLATNSKGDAALLLPMPRGAIAKRTVMVEVAAEGVPAPELGGLGDRRFAHAGGFWRVESIETEVDPEEDVWVALPKLPETYANVEKDANGTVWFFVSALAPKTSQQTPPAPGLIHVAWDASGSRSGGELALDHALLAALPSSASYRLIVFRDVPEVPRDYASVAELADAVKNIAYDGGTDLAALSAVLPDDQAPILVFSDGLDTLSGKALDFGNAKPIAVVSKSIADRETLRQACAGALIDLQTTDIATAVREIFSPSPRVAGVQGTGIADLQGLGRPASGRVSMLGRLTESEATLRIEFGGGAESPPFLLRASDAREGQTLATAWAAARVAQLSPRAEEFADDLLALGRRHGLVSPATSLLVLESLDQWVRHEIEPPASLPAMRESWRTAMKNRDRQNTEIRAQHLAALVKLWQERVDWWKTDFSKVPLPATRPQPDPRATPETITFGGGMPPAEMPAERQPVREALGHVFGRTSMRRSAPAAMAVDLSVDGDGFAGGGGEGYTENVGAGSVSAIQIKAWDPGTPYLKALKTAGKGKRYEVYLAERKHWAQSPAFFLDCAEFFLTEKETETGLRILSNLAEFRIEDAALLRVYAWRLRQAGQTDRAVTLLRRVARLRGEEPQSFRDLALVLAERGKATRSGTDLVESMDLLLRVALTPWARHADSIPIFALEELNALVAWVEHQTWKEGDRPIIPEYDEKLRSNLDTDLRIVLAWDADATDIDLHVGEPTGEEAYYGHNRTSRGGLVSRDITDGYGPEEYLIRRAPKGTYTIQANYFGSRQQTVVGPATVTATVFTDWGRTTEKRETLAVRLDKPRDKVTLGSVTFGASQADGSVRPPVDFGTLRVGVTKAEVAAAFGDPDERQEDLWSYVVGARSISLQFDPAGRLVRAVETLPGNVENVLVQ